MTTGSLPRMTPKALGNMKVHALVDSVGLTRQPVEMLIGLPEATVGDHADWLAPDYLDMGTGRMVMAYSSFVIQLEDRVILVDCAVGEDGNFPTRPDWHEQKSDWLNHLGQAGLSPEDVDTVFLTHLHVDHTGWLTRKSPKGWLPTFPGATHLASQKELEYWRENHEKFAYMSTSFLDSVAPVLDAGLFETTVPETEIAPGLFVVDLSGHSPGMIGLEYRKGHRVVAAFNADLMHSPVQMAAPQCSTLFCADPAAATAIRSSKLAQYAADETVMFCNHFPGECAGRAVAHRDGFRFVPVV